MIDCLKHCYPTVNLNTADTSNKMHHLLPGICSRSHCIIVMFQLFLCISQSEQHVFMHQHDSVCILFSTHKLLSWTMSFKLALA